MSEYEIGIIIGSIWGIVATVIIYELVVKHKQNKSTTGEEDN